MEYWERYLGRVTCADCRDVIKNIPDNTIHLSISSPPYNVGIDYGVYKDNLPREEYVKFVRDVYVKLIDKLVPGGHMVIQVANTRKNPNSPEGMNSYFPLNGIISAYLMDWIPMVGEVIWDKQYSTNSTAWGSWLSANRPSFRDSHEYVLVFRKEGDRQGESDITPDEFTTFTRATWRIQPETQALEGHPAAYPEELCYRLIKLLSFKNDIVFDPFCGTGTTVKMAKQLGRRQMGSEINPDYVRIANERLGQEYLC